MSCAGCGKQLKREIVCKSCSCKPWHEVNVKYGEYALIFFKKSERYLHYCLDNKFFPLRWDGDECTDELTEITTEDRNELWINRVLSVNDVLFINCLGQKNKLEFHRKYKKDTLRLLNQEREEDDSKAPKCGGMKRECRVCKTKKPLDFKHFWWRRHSSGGDEEINDLLKIQLLGYVCRSCFNKQIAARKELKRLKINVGGWKHYGNLRHSDKMMLLSMGRTLVEIKTEKRRIKNESNNTDVYGKQHTDETDYEGNLQTGRCCGNATGV